MNNSFNLLGRQLSIAIGLISVSFYAQAATPVFVIKSYGQHIGGNVVYQHQVTNNSTCKVGSFSIAEETDQVSSSIDYNIARGELSQVFPLGYQDFDDDVLPGSVTGLPGWKAQIIQIEDSGLYMKWDSGELMQTPDILPGQTARFSVTVPKMDAAYLTGHFSAHFGGTCPWIYNGTMEKLDTTPPVLTVTLNPAATTLAQRGQLVPIIATITVTDDYDPAPEIKLLSIVANQPLTPADVQGAAIGTDDRSFSLLASRTNPMVIRTYMISYIATDASGNTARASVLLKIN